LPTAPGLAALLALHAVALPSWLAMAPVEHGLAAAVGCLVLAACAAPAVGRLCLGRGVRAPRRLSFTAEGDFRLDLAGGFSEPVAPAGRSLIAGPWWVLVLEGARSRHYVLLETRRVDPACLAALGRVLRRVAASPGPRQPALRCLMDPRGPAI
jgi:hypothetical protein